MLTTFDKVLFKAMDGVALHGLFFPAKSNGAAVLMSPGFQCVKEMMLPELAASFQRHGINVLIYDQRGYGESTSDSDYDCNPAQHLDDCVDAFTFLLKQPNVNPEKAGYWGVSYSGTISLCAAAIDQRAKFVISCCPWVKYLHEDNISKYLVLAVADRESRIAGGSLSTIQLYDGETIGPFHNRITPDGSKKAQKWSSLMKRQFPGYRDVTTVQTLANLIKWSPTHLIRLLKSAPVLMLIPEQDQLSPPEEQMNLFNMVPSQKVVHVVKGEDHFGFLTGSERHDLQYRQVAFIFGVVGNALSPEESKL